jgi:hypothetical protein
MELKTKTINKINFILPTSSRDYSIEKPRFQKNPLETPARKIMLFRSPDSQGFLAGGCPERPLAPLMDAIT